MDLIKRPSKAVPPVQEADADRDALEHARSGADYFADDIEDLHLSNPGWDEPMRVRGAMRRLRGDRSPEAIQAVEAIFGRETVIAALKQLGAKVSMEVEAQAASQGLLASRL